MRQHPQRGRTNGASLRGALLGVLVLFLLLCGMVPAAADAYYDIRDYDVHMVVGRDNRYDISETITAHFKSPRHGIFRTIPTEQYGYRHKLSGIEVINPDTGAKHPYSMSREGSLVTLRIGDADVYVEGDVRYLIRYTYDAGDDRNKDYDEVYYNLIGTEWDTAIEKVSLRVDLPDVFDATELWFYSGLQGSTDSDVDWQVSGNTILAQSTRPLSPYEGITIQLALEEGYFSEVVIPNHWPLVVLLCVVNFGALVVAWFFKQRDANGHKIVPILSFAPPQGLNPAEAAYVYKEESLTNEDVAALIVHWAAHGLLRIEEVPILPFIKRGTLVFHKTGGMTDQAPAYERSLFNRFWACGTDGTVTAKDLEDTFYSSLTAAAEAVKKKFKGDKEILVNKFQARTAWGGTLALLLTVLSVSVGANALLGGGVFWGAFILTGLTMIFAGLTILIGWQLLRKGKASQRLFALPFFLVFWFMFIGIGFLESGVKDMLGMLVRPETIPVALCVPLGLLTMVTLWQTKVYTPYAIELLSQVRGFRNFLATTKRDRLEMLFAEHPTWFYDMLPFAMAFGMTKIWERHMQTLAMPPPTWYSSQTMFSPSHFTGSMRSMVRSATSTPQSSSSGSGGGGGSSGGGGGGGGGGSW